MRTQYWKLLTLTAALVVFAAGLARAADVFDMPTGQTSLQFVTVSNPGNAADTTVMNDGTTGYGSVSYGYRMGRFDVTASQYVTFLNAVAPGGPGASTDPYGLYSGYMNAHYGSGILYQSSTHWTAELPNQPVNYVSWGSAARFCNWLANGQPTTGIEDLTTTEDGSYYLNGATSSSALMVVTRKSTATYVIPTENEWYKAAYYDPNQGGPGVAGYWLYATKNNNTPSNVLSSTGTNNANYNLSLNGSPYTTDVGYFAGSPSTYGTYDQAGNVWNWLETAIDWYPNLRGLRGGSFVYPSEFLASTERAAADPTYLGDHNYQGGDLILGFRVAEVPEPSSLAMLAGIALTALLYYWRRRKA